MQTRICCVVFLWVSLDRIERGRGCGGGGMTWGADNLCGCCGNKLWDVGNVVITWGDAGRRRKNVGCGKQKVEWRCCTMWRSCTPCTPCTPRAPCTPCTPFIAGWCLPLCLMRCCRDCGCTNGLVDYLPGSVPGFAPRYTFVGLYSIHKPCIARHVPRCLCRASVSDVAVCLPFWFLRCYMEICG